MRYSCPFCEYASESRSSVEGHISGKSDSLHKGKVGRMYRSDIEQDSEPTTVTESIRQKAGVNVSKNDSIREELADIRSVVEEIHKESKRAVNEAESARSETVSGSEVRRLRQRVDDLEERSQKLTYLLLQQISESYRCPSCHKSVKREEFNRVDIDKTDVLRCPNCEDEIIPDRREYEFEGNN
jgi:hypothetical protein